MTVNLKTDHTFGVRHLDGAVLSGKIHAGSAILSGNRQNKEHPGQSSPGCLFT